MKITQEQQELINNCIEKGTLTLYKITIAYRNIYRDNISKKIVYKKNSHVKFYDFWDLVQNLPLMLYHLTQNKIDVEQIDVYINHFTNLYELAFDKLSYNNKHIEAFAENQEIYKAYLKELIDNLKDLYNSLKQNQTEQRPIHSRLSRPDLSTTRNLNYGNKDKSSE